MLMQSGLRLFLLSLFAALAVSCSNETTNNATPVDGGLELEIFVSEPAEINVVSTLIMGPEHMMVVSAQATKSAASRLADLIEEKDRKLVYIFLTHPHFDHYQGASVLKERFPDARFIAPPEVARLQRVRAPMDDENSSARMGDNAAVPSPPAEDYASDVIEIDGQTIEIWSDIIADVGMGRPEEPHVALYIPSLNAFVAGDAVNHDAHVFMGGTTKESRAVWLAQIDEWLERDFDILVPGHMAKSSLPTLTPEAALTLTRAYIVAYEEALAKSDTAEALAENMIKAFPDIRHQQGLYLGAMFDFQEFRSLDVDEKGNVTFGAGPATSEEAQAQKAQYEALRELYNPVEGEVQ